MDSFLYIVGVISFVLLIYIIIPSKKPKNGKYYIDNVNSLDITREDYFKVLNFMLLYGIITNEEYMKLELKGLSYTR